jgi:hypothetical protein
MQKSYHNARIEQWMETLEHYDMIIRHISERDNTTADAHSRFPVDTLDVEGKFPASIIHASTQAEFPQVNMVTTRAMARARTSTIVNGDCHPNLPEISNVSRVPSASRSPSPDSATADSSLHFDHAQLNHLQNQDSNIA